MFRIGDWVIYGHEGVCRVEDIGHPSVPGLDPEREYYCLKPYYHAGTIYAPVDGKIVMRPVISRSALDDLLPRSMIPVVIKRSGIPGEEKVHSVTKQQRHALLDILKHFTIDIACKAPVEDAIVTSGGVKVKEVDPTTMASRLVLGLYFAGEILDVDAYTGGFNLQIAWSTGRLAGLSAAQEEE